MILYEAALSFLGVGVQPPTVELGPDDLRRHADLLGRPGGTCCSPGLALLFTVLAFNLVGDAMQDALNPRSKKT